MFVSVGREVEIGALLTASVSVGTGSATKTGVAGEHAPMRNTTSRIPRIDFVCIIVYVLTFSAQRPALPAAGENQLTKREIAKAQNQLKKRAESQPSGARFVGLLFV
jgi:hypothetical protein